MRRVRCGWPGGPTAPRTVHASRRQPAGCPPLTSLRSTPVSNLACAHLHVHSEYSLLDGACKIDAPRRACRSVRAARPRSHRSRRDERRGGAPQGVCQARHQADRRLRDLSRRRSRRVHRRSLRPHPPARQAQPPHAAGRRRHRLPQPRQALLRRFPGGAAARQADRRPRAGRAPLRGRDRAHRLPRLALLPAPHRRPPRGRARPRRRAAGHLRRRERLLRAAEERAGCPGEVQRGDRAHRARARRAPRGDRRRALPAPRGL